MSLDQRDRIGREGKPVIRLPLDMTDVALKLAIALEIVRIDASGPQTKAMKQNGAHQRVSAPGI